MASIMNEGLRKTIRVLLFTKYIEKLGLKEPKIPDLKFWQNFQLPPMPDVSALVTEANRQLTSANPNDIYTREYLDAVDGYNSLVSKEKEKLDAIVKEQEEIKKRSKNKVAEQKDGIALDLFAEVEVMNNADEAIATAREAYNDAKKEAWQNFELDTIQKYKRVPKEKKKSAKKSADGETNSKKQKSKSVMAAAMQTAIAKQYERYVKKQLMVVKRKVRELEKFYEDCKTIFVETPKNIKRYFTDKDGMGKKMVDEECDKIDRCWDNLLESIKELTTDIATMTAKIPNPDVIVVGTATGVPNPFQKIMIFMENVKKVATDIKKIINYVNEMLSIAKALGFNLKNLETFIGIMKVIEALKGDYDKQFRNAVKQLQKKSKWVAEIKDVVEEPEKDKDGNDVQSDDDDPEHKTRKAGYKYADLDIDWENHTVDILGYRCYCTRKEGSGKKAWHGKSYKKKGGERIDNKGKRYYYISADEMRKFFVSAAEGNSSWSENTMDSEDMYMYDKDGEILNRDGFPVRNENYGKQDSMYAGATYDYDSNTTRLVLADGRIVTIDYLAEVGDRIKLNDGTFIEVV